MPQRLDGIKLFSAREPFDTHCCHMGTAAVKHPVPVPDLVKPSFVIFDIRAL